MWKKKNIKNEKYQKKKKSEKTWKKHQKNQRKHKKKTYQKSYLWLSTRDLGTSNFLGVLFLFNFPFFGVKNTKN